MVDPEAIGEGAAEVAAELEAATGLSFEVVVPSSYAGAVTALCDASERSIAILPAEAYVVAADLCEADADLVAIRGGNWSYWSEILVARDSALTTIEDLDGLVWAHPENGSPSGYLIPSAMLAEAGVTPATPIETVGHIEAVAAVYDGTADFATSRFFPYVDPDGVASWDGSQEGADIPPDLVPLCITDSAGELVCGTLRPRDGRRGVRNLYPNVIQKVRILAVSEPIPNELVVFGGGFPDDIRTQVVEGLVGFATDDPGGFATAFAAYAWEGLAEVAESDLAAVRRLLSAIGFGLDDL
jgi:phosphonate transport system substrate-binding protein